MKARQILLSALVLSASLADHPALAYPMGGGPLVSFGQAVVDFLTGTLGPIVLAIGLCIAAFSVIFGSREGLHKAVYPIVGGALLFSVWAIVHFVESFAR